MRQMGRLPHEALRDTMWVGKGVQGFWPVVAIVALAAIAAWVLH